MTLSPFSNASMNITVITGSVVLDLVVNTSISTFAVLNLRETDTTTLSLTYLQTTTPDRLDIGRITLSLLNVPSGSVLPTQTLPPSVSIPPFTPTITTTATATLTLGPTASSSSQQGEDRKRLVSYAVGLTLGLGLGLTAVVSGAYVLWRRRRRKQEEMADGNKDNLDSRAEAQSQSRRFGREQKDNMDTRWF
ncbi:hypothetical protein VNI00_009481 [Paramarasmius palmivorus]|uniref:Mid2 domain-containing protein n=1 Tax=Paramarasmius palmivorus TaxID=297713 RepID=A0AAW0CPX7_9AGAR